MRARRVRPDTVAEPQPPESVSKAPVDEPKSLGYEKWLGFVTQFVAPSALVTGLLFYFGYVSSRSFFAYFGVDVDVLGLSNQAFVMRSPGALFVPVMVLLLVAAGLIVGHRVLRRRLTTAPAAVQRRSIAALAWTGIVLVSAGLVLAFLWAVIGSWWAYPLLTPLLLAGGAGFAAYAASTARVLGGGRDSRSVVVLLVLVMVAGAFWSTATVAEWWGRGQARTLAADLAALPGVVVDTKERLYPGNSAVLVQELPREGEQEYLYRYHGLRLLVQGGDRLFLVPDQWSANASTLVVPYDGSVRIRFRFFPDADAPTE